MPVGMLILIVLVALAFYFDRGGSDHESGIDGGPKTKRLTR
jgi:hypothetical protein